MKPRVVILLAVFCGAVALAGLGAQTVAVPRTGQVTSYAPGDDGEQKKGAGWPAVRFLDNGNGTVTDTLTGLMWERSPEGNFTTWAKMLAYVKGLRTGGFADWRMPNVNELWSLVNAGEPDQSAWLNGCGFEGIQPDFYWSSTTRPGNPESAFVLSMGEGVLVGFEKSAIVYVLSVRGGP